MREMLVKLGLAEDRDDGIRLSKSRDAALAKSLRSAGWTRPNERETGGDWLPPPE